MKNKIISTIILILSIILIIKSISPLKIYNHIKKGNSFVKEDKYSDGRNEYESALTLKEDKDIRENILKTFYAEKNYEEVVKSNVEDGFLKGNSYVYLGDNSPEKSREFYKKALEEYKLAMRNSNDINIKKNYELTLKKLEDMNKQQNQENQQNNQDNKDKQNQEKNDKNQNSNSQENSNQNKNNEEQNNNNSQNNQEDQQKNNQSSNKEQQDEQKNDSQDKQNGGDSNQQNNNQENAQSQENTTNNSFQQRDETNQEDIRKQEVRAILKRLEGNEKQSFKNNERVMNINSNNPSNRW